MSNGDRDISAFDERLADHAKEKWSNYERIHVDLTEGKNYLLYDVAAEFIAVERASSAIATAQIRLDRPNRQQINITRARIIETVFEKFYLSHAAQPGEWIDLVIGRNFRTWQDGQADQAGESQRVLNVTNVAANVSTACFAGAVQAAHIKADVNNTQTAWIDFGVAAVQADCLPLDPGEWVIMPMSNTNRINVNLEVANEIVFVTPIT